MRVAVFGEMGTRRMRFRAYTLWYDPSWEGCCLHEISESRIESAVPVGAMGRGRGSIAKKLAIAEHREKCVAERK